MQRAADPLDVRLVMAKQLPDRLIGRGLGQGRATAQNLSTSAIIRNITSPR